MSTHLTELLQTFDANLPLAKARTFPSSWYFDPEVYALECRKVFGGVWQYVGRSEQVRAPGSFLTVEVAGEPILVVRDDKGVLRAFHNVCRHRAAQVINEPCGHITKLRCRYHGWTYDLAGRLRGTPEFDGVEEFRKEEQGLPPMAVETWGPFVFVHQGAPRQPLAEFLAPFPQLLPSPGTPGEGPGVRAVQSATGASALTPNPSPGVPGEGRPTPQTPIPAGEGSKPLHFAGRREYDLQCNWKVFIDNYQDGGYHVNTVHPALSGALDYAHYRTENHAWSSVQVSPIKPADDPAVSKVRTGSHAYYWWIFPNLMINLYQGVMDTNWVLPLGPDRCKVFFDFYFTDIESESAKIFNAESMAMAHQVQMEDWGVCEEVQRGLKSRSYSTGRFSVRRESGGYHFHQMLAKVLRSE